jgi:hypothetical protein
MSWSNVTRRILAREALFLAMPMIPDVPGYQQQNNADAANYYVNMIRPRADHLSDGDPDAVTTTTNVLSSIKEKLYEDEPVGFGAATQHMQYWKGASANGFKTYLNETDKDYRVAHDALSDLATLYSLYGKIIAECYADMISVLRTGLAAFQNVDQQALPVVLTTAATVLSLLTAGESLVLVELVGGTGTISTMVSTVSIWTSSDLDTAKSICDGLDSVKDNTIARLKQVNDTVVELRNKIKAATKDVQDNLPNFAKPGQPFTPGTFQPQDPPPNSQPISTAPLIPAPPSSPNIGLRLNPA